MNTLDYSHGYDRGCLDTSETLRAELAQCLRGHMTDIGDGRTLDPQTAREIFQTLFGMLATEQEFGPDKLVDHFLRGIVAQEPPSGEHPSGEHKI